MSEQPRKDGPKPSFVHELACAYSVSSGIKRCSCRPAPQEPRASVKTALDRLNASTETLHCVGSPLGAEMLQLREENARLRAALDTLPGVTAQLRHAYAQVHGGRVSRRGMRQFADGLLAPQIRKLESACLQQSISNQPSTDTIQAVRALYRDDRDAMAHGLLQMSKDLAEARRER